MSQHIQAGRMELHYREAGRGEEILFINGLAADLTIWSAQLADLSQDHRVILFDHRGTGLSGKIDGGLSTELLADDVDALLEVLGIPAATLVGHSLGGLIAQRVAVRHPSRARRLILASTCSRSPKKGRLSLHLWAELLERLGVEAFVDLTLTQNLSTGYMEENWRQVLFMRQLLVSHYRQVPVDPAVLRAYIAAALAHDTEADLHRILVPTLVLAGDQDCLLPPRLAAELAEKIPGARLEILPGAAHNLMLEQPEEFNRRIRAFVKTPRSMDADGRA